MNPNNQIASPDDVRGAVNRQRILELRKSGRTFRKIALKMGLSVSTVHEHFKTAISELHAVIGEKAEAVRTLEISRLDAQLEALWPKRADPRVSDTILRIGQRRADLLGLDAPKNIRLAGEGGGPIKTQDTPVVPLTMTERAARLRDFGITDVTALASNGNGNGNGAHN